MSLCVARNPPVLIYFHSIEEKHSQEWLSVKKGDATQTLLLIILDVNNGIIISLKGLI